MATDYIKKGEHKFFIAIQTHAYSKSFTYKFKKGELTRPEEEEVVTEHIIAAIALSCGIETNLTDTDYLKITTIDAKKNWIKLVDNKIDFDSSSSRFPELIFPGSFNPFHSGHSAMSKLAQDKTGLGLSLIHI